MTASISLTLTEWGSLRSSDISWSDTITLDVVSTILGSDVLGKHLKTTLGSCISRHGLTAKL